MNFLNSNLLNLLLPFLLLPLLIHLFNRKFPKKIIFSSIEFIRKTQAERSKLMRFRHWIMTLLRTVILGLLLFAFLKPVLDKFGSEKEPAAPAAARDTLLIFDHSLSMEHRADLVPARKRALLEAAKIIDSLETGQNLNAISVERDPQSCFFEFSGQHDAVLSFLNNLPPGIQTANYDKAISLAGRHIANSKNKAAGSDIYFISDFQRENWANVRFDKLPESARLFFVDVGRPDRENRAVLDVEISPSTILAGETVDLRIKLGNFTNEVLSQHPLELIVDYTNAVDTNFSCPAWSQTSLNLTMKAPAPGSHTVEVRLPADELMEDNTFHLNLDVLDKEEVVIVTDRIEPETGAPHFVRTAVNPYKDLEGSLLPRVITSSGLDSANLATTSKLLLLELGALNEDNSAALVTYLQRGGGAIWFLDSDMDPVNVRNINLALGDDDELPLHLLGWQPEKSMPDGFQKLNRGNFTSEFLRLFRGTNRQNLGLLNFNKYRQATASDDTAILLSYVDGTPALATANIGLGTLLMANFSVDEANSNLARQQTFPAWLQDLVKNIATGESGELFHEAGTTITANLWRTEARDLLVKNPLGEIIEPKTARDGERVFVSFPALHPGYYRMTANEEKWKKTFAVNPNSGESDLRLMDHDRLPKRANETAEDAESRAHFVSGAEDYEAIQSGTGIFHWFLLALCGMLLIEMLFQMIFRKLA